MLFTNVVVSLLNVSGRGGKGKLDKLKYASRRCSVLGGNVRSPGKTSPAGMIGSREGTGIGRTMKEYEDQLEALKKENFNLKLRIYFLEERMGITSADENAIKKNIELKVSHRIYNSSLYSLHILLPSIEEEKFALLIKRRFCQAPMICFVALSGRN